MCSCALKHCVAFLGDAEIARPSKLWRLTSRDLTIRAPDQTELDN